MTGSGAGTTFTRAAAGMVKVRCVAIRPTQVPIPKQRIEHNADKTPMAIRFRTCFLLVAAWVASNAFKEDSADLVLNSTADADSLTGLIGASGGRGIGLASIREVGVGRGDSSWIAGSFSEGNFSGWDNGCATIAGLEKLAGCSGPVGPRSRATMRLISVGFCRLNDGNSNSGIKPG